MKTLVILILLAIFLPFFGNLCFRVGMETQVKLEEKVAAHNAAHFGKKKFQVVEVGPGVNQYTILLEGSLKPELLETPAHMELGQVAQFDY